MGDIGKKDEVEAFLDLSLRRTFYSSLAGAFAGLLLFRSPTPRWAAIAFGAGLGIGSAYTQCNYPPPKLFETPTPTTENVAKSE